MDARVTLGCLGGAVFVCSVLAACSNDTSASGGGDGGPVLPGTSLDAATSGSPDAGSPIDAGGSLDAAGVTDALVADAGSGASAWSGGGAWYCVVDADSGIDRVNFCSPPSTSEAVTALCGEDAGSFSVHWQCSAQAPAAAFPCGPAASCTVQDTSSSLAGYATHACVTSADCAGFPAQSEGGAPVCEPVGAGAFPSLPGFCWAVRHP